MLPTTAASTGPPHGTPTGEVTAIVATPEPLMSPDVVMTAWAPSLVQLKLTLTAPDVEPDAVPVTTHVGPALSNVVKLAFTGPLMSWPLSQTPEAERDAVPVLI